MKKENLRNKKSWSVQRMASPSCKGTTNSRLLSGAGSCMQSDDMDKTRRSFLKIILLGSSALVLEKVVGPLYAKMRKHISMVETNIARETLVQETQEGGDASLSSTSKSRAMGNFRIMRNAQTLSIRDRTGEEILQIDNSG
jgi:hypothetical protein